MTILWGLPGLVIGIATVWGRYIIRRRPVNRTPPAPGLRGLFREIQSHEEDPKP